MYTLRNVGTLEQQFFLAQSAGFSAVELVGDQGVSADELNRLLKKYNLTVTSAHVQLEALRRQLPETIAFNRAAVIRVSKLNLQRELLREGRERKLE